MSIELDGCARLGTVVICVMVSGGYESGDGGDGGDKGGWWSWMGWKQKRMLLCGTSFVVLCVVITDPDISQRTPSIFG